MPRTALQLPGEPVKSAAAVPGHGSRAPAQTADGGAHLSSAVMATCTVLQEKGPGPGSRAGAEYPHGEPGVSQVPERKEVLTKQNKAKQM